MGASARDALVTLRSLYQASMSGPGGGQHFHAYEREKGNEYRVWHHPDRCPVCAAFNQIEQALLDAVEEQARESTDAHAVGVPAAAPVREGGEA